tara:strand:+ start:377 stop:754 length:378 start_codon:yes stop_codon:yes gene_type:complete
MSTLNVANITDGTDTVETGYVVNGSAKAWCSHTGVGTIAINDSLNASGIVDRGVGQYRTNFSTSFGNTNYAIVGTSNQAPSGQEATVNIESSPSASGVSYRVTGTQNLSYIDKEAAYISCFGDLA